MNRIVDVIFGGNAGSEGKGKFVGHLVKENSYKHAIANFFPNAGHTFVGDDGEKVITKMLPTSLINPEVQLYIGPGSAIDLKTLKDEIDQYDSKYNIRNRLHIHPRAAIVEEFHISLEKEAGLERISSTLRGGSAALSYKAMRRIEQKLAKEIEWLAPFINETEISLANAIRNNEAILIEGAQGFDLDINYGMEYPYTTSRQTTPAQLVADCGLPLDSIRHIYAIIRTYPIRVGNTETGQSGPLGEEIQWEDIKKWSNAPDDHEIKEYTTVTNKLRRVFKPNLDRLKYMISLTNPTFIFLNFVNYIEFADTGKTCYEDLTVQSKQWIQQWENQLNVKIKYLGTGEQNKDIIIRP